MTPLLRLAVLFALKLPSLPALSSSWGWGSGPGPGVPWKTGVSCARRTPTTRKPSSTGQQLGRWAWAEHSLDWARGLQQSRQGVLELGAGARGCHRHTSPPFPGTLVTRAEATDADDPETDNAALRYSILEQGGPQLFSIDALSGDIRTVQVGLDREVRAAHRRRHSPRAWAGQTQPEPPCPVGGRVGRSEAGLRALSPFSAQSPACCL